MNTRLRPFKLLVFLLLILLGGTIFAFWRWHAQASEDLARQAQALEKERADFREKQNATVNWLAPWPQPERILAQFSTSFLSRLLSVLDGTEVEQDGTVLRLRKLTCQLSDDLPDLSVEASVTYQGLEIGVRGVFVVVAEIADEQVQLRVRIADLHPVSVAGKTVPASVRQMIAAQVLPLEGKIPTVPLPLNYHPEFVLEGKEFDLPIPLPAGGKLTMQLSTPSLPKIVLKVVPVSAVWTKEGLCVVAAFDTWPQALQTRTAPPPTTAISSDYGKRLAPFRPTGTDCRIVIGHGVVTQALTQINGWEENHRTLRAKGISSEGDLYSKTGGLPLGYGFRTWFSGAENVQVHRAVFSQFRAVWQPGQGCTVHTHLEAAGSAKIHFHGNGPRLGYAPIEVMPRARGMMAGASAEQLWGDADFSQPMIIQVGNPLKKIEKGAGKVGGAVTGAAKDVGGAVTGAAKDVGGAVTGAVKDVGGAVTSVAKDVEKGFDKLREEGEAGAKAIKDAVEEAVKKGASSAETLFNEIEKLVHILKLDFPTTLRFSTTDKTPDFAASLSVDPDRPLGFVVTLSEPDEAVVSIDVKNVGKTVEDAFDLREQKVKLGHPTLFRFQLPSFLVADAALPVLNGVKVNHKVAKIAAGDFRAVFQDDGLAVSGEVQVTLD